MSAFPSSACNADGEPIMSAEDWRREQYADEMSAMERGLDPEFDGPDPADIYDEEDEFERSRDLGEEEYSDSQRLDEMETAEDYNRFEEQQVFLDREGDE